MTSPSAVENVEYLVFDVVIEDIGMRDGVVIDANLDVHMRNRQLAEAGPRQLSQQVVRHPPPLLSELGCPALCFMDNFHYP